MRRPVDWNGAVGLVVVSLLLVPLASATLVTGTFTTRDSLLLPPEATLTLASEAMILRDSASLRTLTLHADHVDLCRYLLTSVRLAPPVGSEQQAVYDAKEACFPLSKVHMQLALGEHDGWVGFRPASADGAVLHAYDESSVEGRNFTRLSDPASEEFFSKPRDHPGDPAFLHPISRDHLFSEVQGLLSYDGGGELKFLGPDVIIDATQNSTAYRTGAQWGTSPVTADGRIEWVVLRFESANLTLVTPDAPLQIVARHAEARADGILEFTTDRGEVAVDGVVGPAQAGSDVRLDGAFELELAPDQTGRGIELGVTGKARSVHLAGAELAPPSSSASRSIGLWLVLGMGTLVIGAAFSLQRRRDDPTWNDFNMAFEYATCCIEAKDYERGLKWLRTARKLAPRNPCVLADEAHCLHKLGDLQGALECLDLAHRHAKRGEHAVQAARLLGEAGSPLEAMVDKLAAALDTEPGLLAEIEDEFPDVKTSPRWSNLAHLARLRSR